MTAVQRDFFANLRPDVALEPFVVMYGDPRWDSTLDEFASASYHGLDTEFFGPWNEAREIDTRKASVRLIQVAVPSGLVLVADLGAAKDDRRARLGMYERCGFLAVLKKRLEDPKVLTITMNGLTEYSVFRKHYGIRIRGMRDCMLSSQVLWAGIGAKKFREISEGHWVGQEPLRHNLGAICERLGLPIDKELQSYDWSGRLTNEQINYAARDALRQMEALKKLSGMLKRDGLLKTIGAECLGQPAFGECEHWGLPVDEVMAREDIATWDRIRAKVLQVLIDYFPELPSNGPTPIQVGEALGALLDVRCCTYCRTSRDPAALWEDAPPIPTPPDNATKEEKLRINWRRLTGTWEGMPTREEVIEAMRLPCSGCGKYGTFERANMRVFVQTKKNAKNKDYRATTLEFIDFKEAGVHKNPLVRCYLLWKSLTTCRNWMQTMVEHLEGGRIRGHFQQIAGGVDSGEREKAGRGMGRSSCSNPINLQNPANAASKRGEMLGAPPIKRCVRPHDPDLPRRLRELSQRIMWEGYDVGAIRGRSESSAAPMSPRALEVSRRIARDADEIEAYLAGRERSMGVFDLSQAHARIGAQASQDPIMLRDFNSGIDFHASMTSRLLAKVGVQVAPEDVSRIRKDKSHPLQMQTEGRRQTAKIANYAEINLAGGQTLQRNAEDQPEPVEMTVEEATELAKEWRAFYSVFYGFQRQKIREADRYDHTFGHLNQHATYGEIRALCGGRLYLQKQWKDGRYGVKGTDCVSFIWMRTEATAIKRLMGLFLLLCDRHPEWGVEINNFAHDEIDATWWKPYDRQVCRSLKLLGRLVMRWVGITSIPVEEKGAKWQSLLVRSWADK